MYGLGIWVGLESNLLAGQAVVEAPGAQRIFYYHVVVCSYDIQCAIVRQQIQNAVCLDNALVFPGIVAVYVPSVSPSTDDNKWFRKSPRDIPIHKIELGDRTFRKADERFSVVICVTTSPVIVDFDQTLKPALFGCIIRVN